MKELLGSGTKAEILRCLGLKGGCSGRRLGRLLGKSPTPIFKALKQLKRDGIVKYYDRARLYALNPDYLYHDELLRIIQKSAERVRPAYLPRVPRRRRIDPLAIYEILDLKGHVPAKQKLSDVLRQRYG